MTIEQSESIGELTKAMCAANANFTHPVKNAKNEHFKNRYADLTAVIDAYREAYTAAGLVVMQMVLGDRLVTMVCHTSGQWLRYSAPLTPERKGIQAYGSELTYMRRYTLQALAGIAADDDDGNAAQEKTEAPANQGAKAPSAPVSQPQIDPIDRILACTAVAELEALIPTLKQLTGNARENALELYKTHRDSLTKAAA
jgi:hypothetical protein